MFKVESWPCEFVGGVLKGHSVRLAKEVSLV